MSVANGDDERMRRWRLALGPESGACVGPDLSGDDARLDAALEAIYGDSDGAKKKGGWAPPRLAWPAGSGTSASSSPRPWCR